MQLSGETIGRMPPASFELGPLKVSAVSPATAVDAFFDLVRHGGYVSVLSAHGVVESLSDTKLRDIIRAADLVLPDGMPIALAGRLKLGRQVGRMPGAEFFAAVLADPRAAQQKHFFYGGEPESVRQLVDRVRGMIGDEAIAGWHCPPFRPAGAPEDEEVLATMRQSGATIVWVGLSTPKQEYWMHNHVGRLPGVTCIGVGAAFDFLAGNKTRGPAMLSNMGLEWAYRLWTEPKRLWPRYRTVIPSMLRILLAEAMGGLRGRR